MNLIGVKLQLLIKENTQLQTNILVVINKCLSSTELLNVVPTLQNCKITVLQCKVHYECSYDQSGDKKRLQEVYLFFGHHVPMPLLLRDSPFTRVQPVGRMVKTPKPGDS